MAFKKSLLALVVGTLCSTTAMSAQEASDTMTSYAENQAVKHYTVHLNTAPGVATQTNSKVSVEEVSALQKDVFAEILKLDPQAKLISQARILANFVTIESRLDLTSQLQSLPNVTNVFSSGEYKQVVNNTKTPVVKNADEMVDVEPMMPYLGDEQAGAGATVAIISTGIDYTLKAFGGSGEYGEDNDPETPPAPGTYLEALENGAIEYAGFPTDVVVGGWDFAGENWGGDANPIDQNYTYESWNGWSYPTGQGTKIASVVHQLAPGAKLYAYKVQNVSPFYGSPAQFGNVVMAVERALDPNQDGDTSDHLDIAILDADGAAGFFNADGTASLTLPQHLIEKASALGLTIVTFSGSYGMESFYGSADEKHRYWISGQGSSTSAITVGGVTVDEEGQMYTPEWAPLGPVRGSMALKPELVSLSEDLPVAQISMLPDPEDQDPTATKYTTASGGLYSAARIAAAAAVIKSKYGTVGPAEIKAILANTAMNNSIKDAVDGDVAELVAVGHGVENVEAASQTPVFAWDAANSQPYLQFGTHEVTDTKRIVKHLYLRNLSDTSQTYQLSENMFGDESRLAGVTLSYPAMVSIPANGSTNLTVTIDIDADALAEWPLTNTEDFVDEKLKQTEINGYLTLTSESNPTLNVGLMVKARQGMTIEKNTDTYEFPSYLGFDPDTYQSIWEQLAWATTKYPADEWGNMTYMGYVSSFKNESAHAKTITAYPLLLDKGNVSEEVTSLKGHFIQSVGVAVYDEAQCTVTGKKFAMAVNFVDPINVTLANHFDKIQERLFFYDIYFESVVEANGWNESFSGGYIWDENQIFNQPFVTVNAAGQPATYVIDYTVPYDWSNPTGRYKESSLPTYFAGDGRNVVSQFCLEDVFHHEVDSIEDFDQNLGFHIETDRDTGRKQGEPMAQMNPVLGGLYKSEYVCDDWGWCYDQVTDRRANIGFAPVSEEGPNDLDYSHTITVEPNQEVYIAAITSSAGGVGIGSASLADESLRKFLVVSHNDDFAKVGYIGYQDQDGTIIPDVKQGQVFGVSETAENGTVLGEIATDTTGFFTYPENEYETLELSIMNTIEGTPFVIDAETHELVLANADAIDYENKTSYELKVLSRQSNNIGKTAIVRVNVSNENDNSPVANQDMIDELVAMPVHFHSGQTGTFNADLSTLFSDVDGDMLTYTATAETGSVMVEGKMLMAEFTDAGTHSVMVTANDGVNQTQVELAVVAVVNNPPSINESVLSGIQNTEVKLKNLESHQVLIDISNLFVDAENDALTISVSSNELPNVGLSGDNILALIADKGTYVITVSASDGVNTTSTNLTIEAKNSSSGSVGMLLLGALGLLGFRRFK